MRVRLGEKVKVVKLAGPELTGELDEETIQEYKAYLGTIVEIVNCECGGIKINGSCGCGIYHSQNNDPKPWSQYVCWYEQELQQVGRTERGLVRI